MATIHISEDDVVRDVKGFIAHLRAGNDVVLEGDEPPLRLHAADGNLFRTLGQVVAGLKARDEERGYPLVMDEDFAADMREIIANRKPRESAWD